MVGSPFISICHFPAPPPTEAGRPLWSTGLSSRLTCLYVYIKALGTLLEKFPESILSGKEYFLQGHRWASLREFIFRMNSPEFILERMNEFISQNTMKREYHDKVRHSNILVSQGV